MVSPAPIYNIPPKEKSQESHSDKKSDISLLLNALNQNDKSGSSQPGVASSNIGGHQSNITDINSILLYNIAAMSYQTQQYGQALTYIKLVLENLDQVEEFIQVKSLFLSLQILFELKINISARPIMDLLDMKLKEIEKTIEQKSLIKNQQSTNSDISSINKSSNTSVQSAQNQTE